jgi:hypothetical protein
MSSNGLATIINEKVAKNIDVFSCNICDYVTSKKSNYEKHVYTIKHLKLHLSTKVAKSSNFCETIEKTGANIECTCGNKYKDRSGLWRHHKKCEPGKYFDSKCFENVQNEVIGTMNLDLDENVQNEVIGTKEEFANASNQNLTNAILTLIEQNKELQTQLLELAREGRNTIINNNTSNTSFNLNVYLNETCKNAINMLDYVNSLHLELSDLEETGLLGYSNGMSRIFINGLKDMDVNMRPIHCSDLKREILYIKEDNVWEKDNENRDKIKDALRRIEKKNIMQIPLWVKAHPNCIISSNRDNTPYLNMVMQSTGGRNPAETEDMAKIITNIAKAVVINK